MEKISDYFKNLTKKEILAMIKSILIIIIGSFLLATATFFFYESSGLVTGGIGGVGVLINAATGFNTSYVLLIGNIITLILGLIFLGKTFFIKTALASIVYPLFILLYELTVKDPQALFNLSKSIVKLNQTVTPSTRQLILSTFIGSLLTGVGLGMIINTGGTSGGIDVIQKIMHKYLKIPFSLALYITDGIIVCSSFAVFNVDQVLFAIIAILLIGVIVDKMMFIGKSGYSAFIIIDKEFVPVLKKKIIKELDRSFVKIKTQGGYTDHEQVLVICTVTRNQANKLRQLINSLDELVFSFVFETRETLGYGFKKED